jgi:hypothetical protein
VREGKYRRKTNEGFSQRRERGLYRYEGRSKRVGGIGKLRDEGAQGKGTRLTGRENLGLIKLGGKRCLPPSLTLKCYPINCGVDSRDKDSTKLGSLRA